MFGTVNFHLTLSLTMVNSTKALASSTFSTEIISINALAIAFDAGMNAAIKSSIDNYFIAQVADPCGIVCRSSFYWSFSSSNNIHLIHHRLVI